MSGDKKLIYFLIALIICLSTILLIKIKMTPKYNPQTYKEIYDEYEEIFGKNDDSNIKDIQENYNSNVQKDDNATNNNNSQTEGIGYIGTSNIKQGNVIGKMIIPNINVECPIIKETTKENLEIAPTKYCGPEVNEIRKFGYSGS
jgi:sortase (surface protein transpeptidase)